MALQRPISTALRCGNCQRSVLRSFIASVGIQPDVPSPPLRHQRRAISQSTPRLRGVDERLWQAQVQADHALNDINETINQSPKASTTDEPLEEAEQPEREEEVQEQEQPQQKTKKEDNLPWYLQAQQPFAEQAQNPLAARQRLPDLPDNPPSILQPLLEHVSVELGMDDLTILDLRSIDPPPALGANLFMIIGTARSEKHLHVSADRLCRWLRTTYKLHPYADGLLGRNELKLKMRRKAKRSKLMSAVGAKASGDSEIDDGIRTGWVCVNLGRVQGGELPKTKEQIRREENIVGFGTQTTGSNVVVQMMTEEKRGEIDLENLWTELLERAQKQKGALEIVDAEKQSTAAAAEASSSTSPSFGPAASYDPAVYESDHSADAQLRA
ncbi:ATPase synthesis protein 25 mitochondrial [Saxophila tyrrhenica]|uniref:ATPase synthesis protein 25 n=1 Tax=Saxophila tyrrhenica TaxID=1690608 RepID=A0AAV9NZ22_9PEZI|nr:ATPase synthesis protein 25 mitochondrial [Saxophila tyrrhenica]